MIDLHCHFLPGVDDGPETLAESLSLAETAVADGIRVSVITPHVHPERYENDRSSLQPVFDRFQAALKDRNIPLEIRLGGETRLSMESLELLLSDEVPLLGELDGYRILLLEFPHHMIPVGSQQFIDKLLRQKIRPLIAHPERNKAVMANPDSILPFVERGCLLQVTAGALVGRFGHTARQTAIRLLENDWVELIATDAHNLKDRPPLLSEGRVALVALCGEERAQEMVWDRPARILGLH